MAERADLNVADRLAALLGGDRSAAQWLYDTFAQVFHARLLRRYPYVDPDDLLHDAFVVFFRNDYKVLRDFDRRVSRTAQTRTALDRHLWGLICGLVTNHRRSASFRRASSIPGPEGVSDQPSTESAVIARDHLEQLDAALRDQGARLYLYFKLRYLEELTPDEISRVTGWSRKTTYRLKQEVDRTARRCAAELGIRL